MIFFPIALAVGLVFGSPTDRLTKAIKAQEFSCYSCVDLPEGETCDQTTVCQPGHVSVYLCLLLGKKTLKWDLITIQVSMTKIAVQHKQYQIKKQQRFF